MKKFELLAPAGDIASVKAAILAGADAIYCGLEKFNARNRAENISFADLNGIIRLAHKNDCLVFITLNIIIIESEIPALLNLLNKLVNSKIDAVIVQDLGLFYLLGKFPHLEIHASTQLTTHNEGQIKFLHKLGANRVNLSRELSLAEIKDLTITCHENRMLTEVFVHGSNCLSFSGLCYLSSVIDGKSGNRGRCSQPCRDQYLTTAAGKDFPLNLKDNSAYSDLNELAGVGVDSLKIEGRIKKFHYIYTVVNAWRKQLQRLYDNREIKHDDSDLHVVFNRGFSNCFLRGKINKGMFIDNSRDNSARYRAEKNGGATYENIGRAKRELYDLKTGIINHVKNKMADLSIAKAPVIIIISGKDDTPLQVSVKTPDRNFTIYSKSNLSRKNRESPGDCLDYKTFAKRLKTINDTEYFIEEIELADLQDNLFIPYKELTAICKEIFFTLNGGKKNIAPVTIPRFKKNRQTIIKPTLSLLISSKSDLYLCHETSANVYFKLPSNMALERENLLDIFRQNRDIIPWFPEILIGDDYQAALTFLRQLKIERIVTNNSGIAYEAYLQKISWIAGPYLNLANSFSLLCLQENFNCHGAFISNELKRDQIKRINKPDNFELYYSIYHPIVLMTSRQCLFQQVTGCEKNGIDANCIGRCERSAVITNIKNTSFLIKKSKGNYHNIYNEINCLNVDIAGHIPGLFDSFFIDLRDVKTKTRLGLDKSGIVQLFENYLQNIAGSAAVLKKNIWPTTNKQYERGI